jgi:hypothetical protein
MRKVLARKLEFKQLGSIAMKSTRYGGVFLFGSLDISAVTSFEGVKCSMFRHQTRPIYHDLNLRTESNLKKFTRKEIKK